MFPISEKREKSVSSLQFSQWFRLRKVFFFTQFHVNMWSLFCVWWCIWILQPRGRLHMSIYSNQINANSKREEKKMWRMKLCWHCAMELITNSIWFCKSFFCVISICIKVIIIHINWFHFHADSIHSYCGWAWLCRAMNNQLGRYFQWFVQIYIANIKISLVFFNMHNLLTCKLHPAM